MTDPMLAKAAALEKELLRESVAVNDGDMTIATHAERLMHRAALLIQQMRVRLESHGQDEEPGGGLPPEQAAEMAASLGRAAFERIDAEMMGEADGAA